MSTVERSATLRPPLKWAGGKRWQVPHLQPIWAYRDVFADWTFTCRDIEAVPLDRHDFVYADPPYDVEFTQYAKDGFTWDDQERTALWLSKHRGPVVLVNQATDRVEKLYRRLGYSVRFLDAPAGRSAVIRQIGRFAMKPEYVISILTVISLCGIMACTVRPPTTITCAKILKLHLGMSKDEVVAELGMPAEFREMVRLCSTEVLECRCH